MFSGGLFQEYDVWQTLGIILLKHLKQWALVPILKSPVPSEQGGGPESTCMKLAVALVFCTVLPTGTPSLLSEFPAIVLPAATRLRLLPGSGRRWDAKRPISPLISFCFSRRRRSMCERERGKMVYMCWKAGKLFFLRHLNWKKRKTPYIDLSCLYLIR